MSKHDQTDEERNARWTPQTPEAMNVLKLAVSTLATERKVYEPMNRQRPGQAVSNAAMELYPKWAKAQVGERWDCFQVNENTRTYLEVLDASVRANPMSFL